jgi:transposase
LRQKSEPAEQVVKDIRRHPSPVSAEEKIRIVLSGLSGEDSIAERCRREGIARNLSPAAWHPGTPSVCV